MIVLGLVAAMVWPKHKRHKGSPTKAQPKQSTRQAPVALSQRPMLTHQTAWCPWSHGLVARNSTLVHVCLLAQVDRRAVLVIPHTHECLQLSLQLPVVTAVVSGSIDGAIYAQTQPQKTRQLQLWQVLASEEEARGLAHRAEGLTSPLGHANMGRQQRAGTVLSSRLLSEADATRVARDGRIASHRIGRSGGGVCLLSSHDREGRSGSLHMRR